jgi:hypothetical protein
MDFTAIENFRAVDQFLAGPGIQAADLIHTAGHDTVRILLRRSAAEANGSLFEQWEWIQVILGLSLAFVMLFGNRPPKLCIAICLAMLVLVLVERFALTPEIVRLGRTVEFLPADPKAPARVEFGAYHGAYSIVDLVKILGGFAISFILIVRPQPDPQMFVREAEAAAEAVAPMRRAAR